MKKNKLKRELKALDSKSFSNSLQSIAICHETFIWFECANIVFGSKEVPFATN